MIDQITVVPGFYEQGTCALWLRQLFDRRALWEDRSNSTRRPHYRNGHYFSLGASVYMDLTSPDDVAAFAQKVQYFNPIMLANIPGFYRSFLAKFQSEFLHDKIDAKYLCDVYPLAPLPGFHIFPPEETLAAPFGKVHRDTQWEALLQLPEFPFKAKEVEGSHFTFTLPLALPFQGGGMLIPKDAKSQPTEFYFYDEGSLYVHSGQFPHQVLPIRGPVIPLDWRITFQGHGFMHKQTAYLYW